MSEDIHKNLKSKDKTKEVRKKYNERKEVKLRRVRNHIENIRELMAKQKLDEIRGSTYRSGEAVAGLLPSRVEMLENKKKEEGNINCKLPGCNDEKTHKTSVRSKHCKYYKCTDKKDLHESIEKEMRKLYPEDYGESMLH